MTLTINDPAYPHLPGEKSFEIADVDGTSVNIHPWHRPEYADPNEVAISVGNLADDGKDHSGDMHISIVNRQDFVEGLLAVFPELKRA